MQNSFTNDSTIPAGLKAALTQNMDALNKFSALPQEGQAAFVQGARQVGSKKEMQAYVGQLLQG